MSRKPSAGDFVDARCTRCRVVTNHTIVAMVGEQIVRVVCNTCNGTHNYHPPKPAPSPRAPKAEKAPAAPRAPRMTAKAVRNADEEEWVEATRQADPAKVIRYDMGRAYSVGHFVNHPSFGVGLVKSVTKPNKMEVLFESGRKLLRCQL
jgi:hypothetical protein